MLSLLRAWVQSLVWELRSHKPCGTAKKKVNGLWNVIGLTVIAERLLRFMITNLDVSIVVFFSSHIQLPRHKCRIGRVGLIMAGIFSSRYDRRY